MIVGLFEQGAGRRGRRGFRQGGLVQGALVLLAAIAAGLAPTADAQGREFYGVNPLGPLVVTDYDRMQRGGVGTLRVHVSWTDVEPSPGSYRWGGRSEAMIGNAAARGIRPLVIVHNSPEHVRTPPTRASDRRAFSRVMQALAARYGPGGTYWQGPYRSEHPGKNPRPVRSWQLWNEQNGRTYWGARAQPRAYGRLVRAGARGVRSQHRKAEIVLGGMFGTPSGKGSMTSWRYLKRLYGVKGIKRAFSTVALHPYSPGLRGIRYQIRRIRNVMRRSNDARKRIRVTEIGWGSARGGHPLLKGPKGQARMLRKSFRLLTRRRKAWKVRGLNWTSWQDGTGGCAFCPSSGLFSGPPDAREPKPSWRAFRRIAR